VPLIVLLVLSLLATTAEARPSRRRSARRHPPAARVEAPPAEIPVEVGWGPIALIPNPPATFDQVAYAGLQLQMAAVVDQALIRRHRSQIPAWARGTASRMNEIRVRPWWLALVPEVLVVSPAIWNTGLYGGIWRPFGLGLNLVDTERFDVHVEADVDFVALYMHSSTLGGGSVAAPSSTFVLRPGVHLALSGELLVTNELRLSAGWSSDLFVPQALGRSIFEVGPDNSLWHLGGPFLLIQHRFTIPL
jgi:hypothetical protein